MNGQRRWRRLVSFVIPIVLVGASLTSCGSDEEPRATYSMELATQALFVITPGLVAVDQGFMAEEGVESLTFPIFSDVPAMLTAVHKGEVDAALQNPFVAALFNKASGYELRAILPSVEFHTFVVVRPDNSDVIQAAAGGDWKAVVESWSGKSIGVPALGAVADLVVKASCEEVGLKESECTTLAAGAGAAGAASLREGIVDIIASDVSSAAKLIADGEGVNVLSYGIEGPEALTAIQGGVILTSQNQLDTETEAFKAFSRGWMRGVEFLNDPANKDSVVDTLANHLEYEKAAAGALYDLSFGLFDGPMDAATIEKTLSAFAGMGVFNTEGQPPLPELAEELLGKY